MDNYYRASQHDPREPYSGLARDSVAGTHPDAPAGGPGPGRFSSRVPLGMTHATCQRPPCPVRAPHAPVWSDMYRVLDGIACVNEAFERAPRYAFDAIVEETGQSLGDLLHGLLPGLLTMLAALAVPTLVGAAIGGGLGALAGGVGAVPGAALGASIGLRVGVVLLNWLGIGFLAVYVTSKLGEMGGLLVDGAKQAWDVGGREPAARAGGIDGGAKKIARAVGVLFRLILEGLVLYGLAKGLGALLENLKDSRLGVAFARWVETNWEALAKNPKLNPELRKGTAGGGAEATLEPSAPAPPPARPSAPRTTAPDVVTVNRAGKPYPSVLDPRTGEPIPFPEGELAKVPKADRVPWGAKERGEYIAEWYRRGFSDPPGGWREYDIHHIKPRELGGTNAFENLVPVERGVHQSEFNSFWRDF